MAQFTVNPRRFDPYKDFRFRVKWDGRYVAGISIGQRIQCLCRITRKSHTGAEYCPQLICVRV